MEEPAGVGNGQPLSSLKHPFLLNEPGYQFGAGQYRDLIADGNEGSVETFFGSFGCDDSRDSILEKFDIQDGRFKKSNALGQLQ